jgi:hypothetical protein
MIRYFIQFLGVDKEQMEDMNDIIDEANNKIMFSYNGNLRSFCLYLKKMLNFERLELLEEVQSKFKKVDILGMGDIPILLKELQKNMERQITELTKS